MVQFRTVIKDLLWYNNDGISWNMTCIRTDEGGRSGWWHWRARLRTKCVCPTWKHRLKHKCCVWIGSFGIVLSHLLFSFHACQQDVLLVLRCVCLLCVCKVALNPSTSAQVHSKVILSLPLSVCHSAIVFSSLPLFVSVRHPEVKPSVSAGWKSPFPHC